MHSTRRMRLGIFLAVLSILVIIYVTTGARSTRESPFYTRTVKLMDRKAAEEAQLANEITRLSNRNYKKPAAALKDRLKDAEDAAKKNADDKWRDVADDLAVAAGGESGSAGQLPAAAELSRLLNFSPITIFSKTYCRFSKKAKHILLEAHSIDPRPYVVELDQHPLGDELQELLASRTGRRTVPNILVEGQSIGGGDDIEKLWRDSGLHDAIHRIAGSSVTGFKQIHAFTEQHH